MKHRVKAMLSLLLAVCLLITSTVVVQAGSADELYLSELRLVYANDAEEARDSLRGTEFEEYEIYDQNLNRGTGEKGVYLAYLTSTDVEDAITDISVMQMKGGYRSGNYQEMIRQSLDEYIAMGEIYLEAIDYMINAYYEGDFLAESAYRQLNFYLDSDSNTTLGMLFEQGIGADALATIFMEGNVYALQNIRSLLAMGVSYNESGEHYLELVEKAAAAMQEDDAAFEDEDNYGEYDDLALLITGTLTTLRGMFEELETFEEELNYEDEEFTDKELEYAEHIAMAAMLREVEYLNDETLYDFCLGYRVDEGDLSPLYPLVAALNQGQLAMTKLGYHYTVVSYSMSDMPEEIMDEEISALEEKYGEEPFDIYTGVDRSIYKGTFAVTNEAYRAENYSEESLASWMLKGDNALSTWMNVGFAAVGAALIGWGIYRIVVRHPADATARAAAQNLVNSVKQAKLDAINSVASKTAAYHANTLGFQYNTYGDLIDGMFKTYYPNMNANIPFAEKLSYLDSMSGSKNFGFKTNTEASLFQDVKGATMEAQMKAGIGPGQELEAQQAAAQAAANSAYAWVTALLLVAGAAMMVYAAVDTIMDIVSYRNPDYDDIPTALVDIRDTENGNRFIKYDAVLLAEPNDNGDYDPADLNAFEGMRWNALYYTKSYEAGKPLVATFAISNNNNVARDGYLSVHRFGEGVCYDLNKYNFEQKSPSIYLSVRQSENQKAAVADVPEVVGSMIGGEYLMITSVIGLLAGAGMTLAVQAVQGKKRTGSGKPSEETPA